MFTNPNQQTQTTENVLDPKKQKGTGFTNIKQILQQNQGAGQRMGQGVSNIISGKTQGLQQNLQGAQGQFQTGFGESSAGASKNIKDAASFIKRPDESMDEYAARIGKTENEVEGVAQPIDYSAIGKQFMGTEYTGPMQLQGQQNLLSQGQNVANLGVLANTQLGQGILARQLANRARYTQGQSALDTALLSRDQAAQNAIRQAGLQAAVASGNVESAIGQAQTQAEAAKAGIEAERAQTEKDLIASLSGADELGDETRYGRFGGGLVGQAEDRAKTYMEDLNKFQDLVTGMSTGEYPEDYAENKAYYDSLLGRMSDFGFDPTDINAYLSAGTVNQRAKIDNTKDILAQLGSLGFNNVYQTGDKYFTDQDRQAAINLSKLIQDKTAQKAIEDAQFETDRINEENFLKNLEAQNERWLGKDTSALAAANELQSAYNSLFPYFAHLGARHEDIGYVARPFQQGFKNLGTFNEAVNIANKVNQLNQITKDYGLSKGVEHNIWGPDVESQKLSLGKNSQPIYNVDNKLFTGQNQALMNVLQNLLANQGVYNPTYTQDMEQLGSQATF